MFKKTITLIGCIICFVACKQSYKHDASNSEAGESSNAISHVNLDSSKTSLKFGIYPTTTKNDFNANTYKDFDVLSYAGYAIDPFTGDAMHTNNWELSPVVDSLQHIGVDCILLATITDSTANRQFLNNMKAMATFIVNSSSKLAIQNAEGIHLQLDAVALADRHKLTNFVTMLATHTHKQGKYVVLSLPNTYPNAFDVKALSKYVDYYVLMPMSNTEAQDKVMKAYLNLGVPIELLQVVKPIE